MCVDGGDHDRRELVGLGVGALAVLVDHEQLTAVLIYDAAGVRGIDAERQRHAEDLKRLR